MELDGVLELRVVEMRHEAEGVVSLALEDPQRRLLTEWECGAHVDLYLGDYVRQYSLCGDPADRTRYRVGVLREPASRGGSAFVHEELRVGDLVEVGGPRNHFELVDSEEYVFIAGGIGITPILPMIRAAEVRGATWHLHYGGRSLESIAYQDLLSAYAGKVTTWPQDQVGLIDLDSVLGVPRTGLAVYCCGPEPLIAAVEERGASFPVGTVHVERFAGRVRSIDTEDDKPFDVVAHRSGARVTVAPGTSIVDCLEQVGIQVPNACRDGVCGSCITRIIEGEPEHRDSLLTPDDVGQIVACVSRAKSGELVLDL